MFVSSGSLSELHVESLSSVTYADVTPGALLVEGNSTARELTGTAPRMDFPHGWPVAKPVQIDVTGNPGDMWIIFASAAKGWSEPAIGVDMIFLLDPTATPALAAGVIPSEGPFELAFPVPDLPAPYWGHGFPMQLVTIDPAMLRGRFGNVRDVIVLP